MEFYLNLPQGVRGYSFRLGTMDLCTLCKQPARNCDNTVGMNITQGSSLIASTIICEDCLRAIGKNYELLKSVGK